MSVMAVLANKIIAIASISIPIEIAIIAWKCRRLGLPSPLIRHAIGFSAFVLSCAATHATRHNIVALWICAIVSTGEAVWLGFDLSASLVKTLLSSFKRQDIWHEFLASSPFAIALVSPDGTIEQSSPAFAAMLGYSLAEFVGKTYQEITYPDDLEEDSGLHGEMVRGERRSYTLEKRYWLNPAIYPDQYIWVFLEVGAYRNGDVFAWITDITEQKELSHELEYQAHHDSLTGLLNRSNINILDPDKFSALALFDLDGFKLVNDVHGHSIGDVVLRHIAQEMRKVIRTDTQSDRGRDLLIRLGGDEFALAIVGCNTHDAVEIASRVASIVTGRYAVNAGSKSVSKLYGEMSAARSFRLGVSAGIASVNGDFRKALTHADIAMYAHKAQKSSPHRNSAVWFRSEMEAQILQRTQVENELIDAINQQQLSLYYQPIFDITATPKLIGFEALSRWQRSNGEWCPPSEFIPISERLGLINSLTLWVIRSAHAQLKAWNSQYKIGINLSIEDLKDWVLREEISTLLSQNEIDPSKLLFEITESMVGGSGVVDAIAQIRSNGGQTGMDDFGSGESNLGLLLKLPLDILKLDRSIVVNSNLASLQCVVQLARSLNLQVCAEGIEDLDTLEKAIAAGCDYAQGYHFGKAMEAGEAQKLIEAI